MDREGRGALVNFDLGDGDLSAQKVQWAIQTVLTNRAALGLNTTLPNYGIVSAYSNLSTQGCYIYTHPDHAAVVAAVRDSDFGLRVQAAATCAEDPTASMTLTVPQNVVDAAYPSNGDPGIFADNYGWLETPVISRTDQSSLFMAVQSFAATNQNVPMTRVSGPDRYATGVAIAQTEYPSGAPVVYLASGENYPDALSAASAAAKQGGPLLLTASGSLPAAVAQEIAALHPSRVVIVGGVNAVNSTVANEVTALGTSVIRIAGNDRYDTSRRVATYAFGPGIARAYVASGSNFPDALSASGAAGATGSPVLLTPGGDPSDAQVAPALAQLAPKSIAVVGGTDVIPAPLEAQLSGIAPVQRLSGSDRFGTNAAVIASVYPQASGAFVASGVNYPDALTGAALAGHTRMPLLLSNGSCLAAPLWNTIATLGVGSMTVLGGPNAVSDSVDRQTC